MTARFRSISREALKCILQRGGAAEGAAVGIPALQEVAVQDLQESDGA